MHICHHEVSLVVYNLLDQGTWKKKIPECWILTISRCGCEGEDGECVTDYGKTTNNVCWIMSWTSQLACLVLNLIFALLAWVSLSHAKYI